MFSISVSNTNVVLNLPISCIVQVDAQVKGSFKRYVTLVGGRGLVKCDKA